MYMYQLGYVGSASDLQGPDINAYCIEISFSWIGPSNPSFKPYFSAKYISMYNR